MTSNCKNDAFCNTSKVFWIDTKYTNLDSARFWIFSSTVVYSWDQYYRQRNFAYELNGTKRFQVTRPYVGPVSQERRGSISKSYPCKALLACSDDLFVIFSEKRRPELFFFILWSGVMFQKQPGNYLWNSNSRSKDIKTSAIFKLVYLANYL